jgi:hypothetical protein
MAACLYPAQVAAAAAVLAAAAVVRLLLGARAVCCLQDCQRARRPLEAAARSYRLEGSRLLPKQLLAAAPALAGLAAVAQDWGLVTFPKHHNPQAEGSYQLLLGCPAAAVDFVLAGQPLRCRPPQLLCSGQVPTQLLALWGQQEGAVCWAVLQLMHRS